MKLNILKYLLLVLLYFAAIADKSSAQTQQEMLSYELSRIAGQDNIYDISSLPQGKQFLQELHSNEAWLIDLLDSGPIKNPKIVLTFLHSIWLDDKNITKNPINLSLANACSLALGMNSKLKSEWMAQRYISFRDAWKNKTLNVCFGDLATWERRYIARGVQRASYTTADAMDFLRREISLPRKSYTGACWRAPYRSYNCFGDSVQGRNYYVPFKDLYSCDPEMVIKVGGVCGALSNLGAAAAVANGIPALSMGEPGHCAYAVQTAPGKWTPAYSLSWKRGLHTSFYRNQWTDLMLSQACFEKPELVTAAAHLQRQSHQAEDDDDIKAADKLLRQAIETHPLHYAIWVDRAEFGIRHKMDSKWWKTYHDDVLALLAKTHEEPAWTLLTKYAYKNMMTKMSNAQRGDLFAKYLNSYNDFGAGRWNIEGAWNWMTDQVGGTKNKKKFTQQLAGTYITSPAFGGAVLAWMQKRYEKDERGWLEFQNWLVEKLDSQGQGADAIIAKLGKIAMPAAAKRGDLDSYQAIGKLCSRLYKPADTKGVEPFPGQLLTEGGAINISGIGNRHDSPQRHWGILNMHGGALHTNTTTTPWIEVKLGNFGKLNGIVIQNRAGGYASRANGARVMVSTDGKDWQQVGKLEGSKRFYRIDLSKTKPQAGWLRIERDGQCMHFARILAFGTKTN